MNKGRGKLFPRQTTDRSRRLPRIAARGNHARKTPNGKLERYFGSGASASVTP